VAADLLALLDEEDAVLERHRLRAVLGRLPRLDLLVPVQDELREVDGAGKASRAAADEEHVRVDGLTLHVGHGAPPVDCRTGAPMAQCGGRSSP
jgi:hypothetical protein